MRSVAVERDFGAEAAGGQRHLGQALRQAAIGNVVNGGDLAGADELAHEIAVAAFAGEIDGRRRAILAAENLAQIDRLADMACRGRRSG